MLAQGRIFEAVSLLKNDMKCILDLDKKDAREMIFYGFCVNRTYSHFQNKAQLIAFLAQKMIRQN
jgi:hypothetical protein